MTEQIVQALGGLGFFLLGMVLLTEGLSKLAGDTVHRLLARFTTSPLTGALTGAGLTAVLQSSSVTTATTVGFVSGGLLEFPQALGVMFGANIGTTATGWLVALLGFELEIGGLFMPLLLVGMLMRLFGRGPLASAGWGLVGFALIFLGIEALQQGMAGFQGIVTPSHFPADTFRGRLLLIGIGFLVTLVTQSSSAGIATALTAVDGGAISFVQAAAIVIGMDVGTTSTTALATIKGSAQTKRTGYAHVVYNLLTAIGALLLLNPYTAAIDRWFEGGAAGNAALALVGFHTTFNGLGVLAVLPFTGAFARLMTRLVPEHRSELAARLDSALLKDPTAAALTLLRSVRAMAAALFARTELALGVQRTTAIDAESVERIDQAVHEARRFAGRIVVPPERPDAQRLLLASMHVIDHLDRLVERCSDSEQLAHLRADPCLNQLTSAAQVALASASAAFRAEQEASAVGPRLLEAHDAVCSDREPYRRRMLRAVAAGALTLEDAIRRLDAFRWLDRTTYNAWRIAHHLEGGDSPDAPNSPETPESVEPPEPAKPAPA